LVLGKDGADRLPLLTSGARWVTPTRAIQLPAD
jgi:hypothetical protein